MAKRRRRRENRQIKFCLTAVAVILVLLVGIISAQQLESKMNVKVENAGKQMTAYTNDESTAQIFMNGQWYRRKGVETLLVMGIDNFGSIASSGSYNNTNQADFLMLFVRDAETGESSAIHLNRDTMTDITMLGVTGEAAGVQHAQLALAYNYGRGQHDSCKNTADAVSNLVYGMEIDHYIALTMDAIPILNDWAGGVTVEILDDFSEVYETMVQGELVKLEGAQALSYVRTRMGLEDSSNLRRMERQRQYAAEWAQCARGQLNDAQKMTELMRRLDGYYRTNCTTEELKVYGQSMGSGLISVYEIEGEAVHGENYMEFYANEEALQQLVLELFYAPADDE